VPEFLRAAHGDLPAELGELAWPDMRRERRQVAFNHLQPLPYPVWLGRCPVARAIMTSTVATRMAAANLDEPPGCLSRAARRRPVIRPRHSRNLGFPRLEMSK
jgi:hypothetical protein